MKFNYKFGQTWDKGVKLQFKHIHQRTKNFDNKNLQTENRN